MTALSALLPPHFHPLFRALLGAVLGVSGADEDDLYDAMDWVLARKDAIENALAARHLSNGTLVLYDVSSAALQGHTCPLGKIGHARDGVKGRLQIVYGLLCSPAGVPIAIEVFDGNTADPKTLATQIDKLKTRFGLTRVVLVGDRGMLTSARIRDELRPAQLDWISGHCHVKLECVVVQLVLELQRWISFGALTFQAAASSAVSSPQTAKRSAITCR